MSGKGAIAGGHHDYNPQCAVCGIPLSGLASYVVRLAGIGRSSRNPNLCSRCNTHAEEGRIVEMTVLFADLSSFAALTHQLGPERTHAVVDAFLQAATRLLVAHDAFIDKYVGDGVMALFNVPIRRGDHAAQAVAAAMDIQAAMPGLGAQFALDLRAGVGIASGWARVGRLGGHEGKDYTAIGNVVNLAARLEGEVRPGEVLVDETVYRQVCSDFPSVPAEFLSLKGFPEAVRGYRLRAAGPRQLHSHPARASDRHWALPAGSVVFAILGAPCATVLLLGPLAPALGLGALVAGLVTTVVPVLDQGPLRIPLLVLATLAALANLYTIGHARAIRRRAEAEGHPIAMTAQERRWTAVVVAASSTTLLFVALELFGHQRFHDSLL